MRGVVRGAIGATLCLLMHAGFVAAQGAITLLAGNQDPAEIGAAVEAFEREHPDIDVTLVLEAWDTVDDKFVTMVAAGEPPDVFINNSVYGWAKYAYQGLFQDLTPLVRRDAASLRWNEFFEPAIEQSKIGGTLYGMPAGPATGFATTYNATLFREAGLQAPPTDWSDPAWDWDAMVAAAKKLTEVGPDGRATQYGVDFWDADGPLLAMAYAYGGDWFDPASYRDGVVHEVTLASPENARAYQAVADLRIKDAVRPGGPLGGVGGGIDNFGGGRIAMWLEVVQYNPRTFTPAAQFEWGFAPFPFPEGSARDR
ncbi:MAG TPA: extracellular solute-binding protein, partial [Limnochordia bacterium]